MRRPRRREGEREGGREGWEGGREGRGREGGGGRKGGREGSREGRREGRRVWLLSNINKRFLPVRDETSHVISKVISGLSAAVRVEEHHLILHDLVLRWSVLATGQGVSVYREPEVWAYPLVDVLLA